MNIKQKIVIAGFIGLSSSLYAAEALTGRDGMTLYTFDADANGRSACNGACLAVWPAAKPGDAKGGDFGEMTREDGVKQLTHRGKPLYYYVNDKKPGDRNGDKLQNVWHVAMPGAARSDLKGTASSASGRGY